MRRNLFLIISFLLLILIITKNFGTLYGLAYLFLDPEYLDKVNFWSFFLVGIGFGAFVLTWNITSYILNSHRFPFLATFERPFTRFCLNNSIIPLLFALIYLLQLISFQMVFELSAWYKIVMSVLGFLSGALLMLAISFSKSLNTHYNQDKAHHAKHNPMKRWRFNSTPSRRVIRVDYFLIYPWKIRRVREVDHYDEEKLLTVFKQHHRNALVLELIALEIIILLGFLMDYKIFRVPASSSIFLLFSILVAPIGAFSYYLKSWGTTVFISLIILFNLMLHFDFMNHKNKAFGLNYDLQNRIEYNLPNIEEKSEAVVFNRDREDELQTLMAWKKKFTVTDSTNKPTLVLINCSGGGLRAAVWSFYVMQVLDSLSQEKFFNHSTLITGASGGTLGAAYYRELYLRKLRGEKIDLSSDDYLNNVSKDMLNAVSFAFVVNDLLIPWQRFRVGDNQYRKDRGYLWEEQLNENTNGILDKPIGDYTVPESDAQIPMLVFTPTIIDDARRLNISARPVAYLNRPSESMEDGSALKVDAIDLQNFFSKQDAEQLRFTTAIRMNATFPYIMPNVFLPTTPEIQTMDAGLRDNFGLETSMRYLDVFKNWINENVGDVIIVQMRDMKKNIEPKVSAHQSLMSKLFDPINSIYANWSDYQDFHFDEQVNSAANWLKPELHILTFEYTPSETNSAASMSWHLTTKEKQDVINAMKNWHNQTELKKALSLLQ
ncbi:MAG: patatin-like phospholipase family protein [Bacteroidota bacterium]